MADLIFYERLQKLTWERKSLHWCAISGPFRLGMLPNGFYKVERRRITEYTKKAESPYKDKTGKGFFLPITPLFETNRDGFGIHPDGNVYGTLGCIGLTDNNTESFYDAIASTLPSTKITLQVINNLCK